MVGVVLGGGSVTVALRAIFQARTQVHALRVTHRRESARKAVNVRGGRGMSAAPRTHMAHADVTL